MEFPGTINIGHEALLAVMRNIVASLYHHGARKILFLNGHGGNSPALDAVALEFYQKGGIAAIIEWWVLASQLKPEWAGGHADAQETAAVLAISPELVHLEDSIPSGVKDPTPAFQVNYLNSIRFKNGSIRIPRAVWDVTSAG